MLNNRDTTPGDTYRPGMPMDPPALVIVIRSFSTLQGRSVEHDDDECICITFECALLLNRVKKNEQNDYSAINKNYITEIKIIQKVSLHIIKHHAEMINTIQYYIILLNAYGAGCSWW